MKGLPVRGRKERLGKRGVDEKKKEAKKRRGRKDFFSKLAAWRVAGELGCAA